MGLEKAGINMTEENLKRFQTGAVSLDRPILSSVLSQIPLSTRP